MTTLFNSAVENADKSNIMFSYKEMIQFKRSSPYITRHGKNYKNEVTEILKAFIASKLCFDDAGATFINLISMNKRNSDNIKLYTELTKGKDEEQKRKKRKFIRNMGFQIMLNFIIENRLFEKEFKDSPRFIVTVKNKYQEMKKLDAFIPTIYWKGQEYYDDFFDKY